MCTLKYLGIKGHRVCNLNSSEKKCVCVEWKKDKAKVVNGNICGICVKDIQEFFVLLKLFYKSEIMAI